MKYLVLVILSLLLFSCSEGNKDDNSEIGFTSKECAKTRGIYYEYMDNNCTNCNITDNNTVTSCAVKYPENFRSADGKLQECLKEIFLPDLEVMKTWANTEIEEQTPLCRQAFPDDRRIAPACPGSHNLRSSLQGRAFRDDTYFSFRSPALRPGMVQPVLLFRSN